MRIVNFKEEILSYILIVFFSVILVFNLFLHGGEPATFDGRIHITNIAQHHSALLDGDIWVTWADGLGNYGLPIPLIAQQTAAYAGAMLDFVVKNSLLSYKILYLVGALLSNIFFYQFVRIYWQPKAALLGVLLFNFAPYRIINIYIRGAQPEFLASIFLPLILILLNKATLQPNSRSFALLVLSVWLLALTHPMLVLIYSVIYIPYIMYLFIDIRKKRIKRLLFIGLAFALGLGLAGFYLIPLLMEMKYFYVGQSANLLVKNSFMSWQNFINPKWYDVLGNDVWTRGHFIKAGLPETLIFMVAFLFSGYAVVTRQIKRYKLLLLFVIAGLISIFFLTKLSLLIYQSINILSKIQHPWRFLSAFIFIPPVILTMFFAKYSQKLLLVIFVLIIAYMRLPQLYGKNYTVHPEAYYLHTKQNLQMVIFNPIWTGLTEEYPVKDHKGEIIEGKGQIIDRVEKNSWRRYKVNAAEKIRMADYTFYFPGWNVYIDGKKISLRELIWQDPNYRGVITYYVPKGKHDIQVVFEQTKIRKIALSITAAAGIGLLGLLIINAKYQLIR